MCTGKIASVLQLFAEFFVYVRVINPVELSNHFHEAALATERFLEAIEAPGVINLVDTSHIVLGVSMVNCVLYCFIIHLIVRTQISFFIGTSSVNVETFTVEAQSDGARKYLMLGGASLIESYRWGGKALNRRTK